MVASPVPLMVCEGPTLLVPVFCFTTFCSFELHFPSGYWWGLFHIYEYVGHLNVSFRLYLMVCCCFGPPSYCTVTDLIQHNWDFQLCAQVTTIYFLTSTWPVPTNGEKEGLYRTLEKFDSLLKMECWFLKQICLNYPRPPCWPSEWTQNLRTKVRCVEIIICFIYFDNQIWFLN